MIYKIYNKIKKMVRKLYAKHPKAIDVIAGYSFCELIYWCFIFFIPYILIHINNNDTIAVVITILIICVILGIIAILLALLFGIINEIVEKNYKYPIKVRKYIQDKITLFPPKLIAFWTKTTKYVVIIATFYVVPHIGIYAVLVILADIPIFEACNIILQETEKIEE